jgi:hypothetical protein
MIVSIPDESRYSQSQTIGKPNHMKVFVSPETKDLLNMTVTIS